MPSAEIITIGTEILLGDILDTNAQYIARSLRNVGVDLFRKTTVGDNIQRIARIVQESLSRCDIVITTGGLGPTVDDPTREAVALALGVDTEYRGELWDQIVARFQRYRRPPTDNNRRQAYVPQGAIAVENPVGTAPAFIVEIEKKSIICLPGVPREMEYLWMHRAIPYLRQRYGLTGIIKTRLLHTAGVGESVIDDRIGDLERLSNPTVGLAAHSGQVDVRIAVKAGSEAEADTLIAPIETELRERLGKWIYGVDQETLEEVALRALDKQGWGMAVIEAGLGGELIRRLTSARSGFKGGKILANLPSQDELAAQLVEFQQQCQAEVGLGVAIYPGAERQEVFIEIITPTGSQQHRRPYGGMPDYAARWASNHCLDILRNLSSDQKG